MGYARYMSDKPTLTFFSPTGIHNENIDATTDRLMQMGSWKNQRIVMIVPSAEMISAKVALSWMSLMWPPNQAVIKTLAIGGEVGDAYSSVIEQILADPNISKFEYILTCETDNLPQGDAVIQLLKAMEDHPEFSAISALYFTKGDGGVAQIWGDIHDPNINFRPQLPRNGEIVECVGTGMGFVLWRLEMFKDTRLRKPWFKTIAGKEGVGTQDLYFWGDARKYGYRCAVDCRVPVGHIDVEGKYGFPGIVY